MGLSVISAPRRRNILSYQVPTLPIEDIKMVQMEGTFLRTEEKDYDKFLAAVGVGFLLRKAATASTPTMTISKSGDKWTMVTATTLKKIELVFELGVPFDETTTDGRDVTTTVTKEGDNKLITVQKPKKAGGKEIEVTRIFTDDGIKVAMKCGDVVSDQYFKRQ